MAQARRKSLVGRTIVDVRFNPFPSGRMGQTAHDPVLVLDDGREVYFITEECEDQYGTSIQIRGKKK